MPKKKTKVQVGVCDPKLGAAINEALSVSVTHVGVVPEVSREASGSRIWSCVMGRSHRITILG